MGKFSKFKDILSVASGVAKPFVPGSVGSVLDAVNTSIADKKDAGNTGALDALARDNDEQTQAILALHARLSAVEAKLKGG